MKNRKQKHSEYEQKFGNIPIDYKERLSWMYDQYKITDRQALEIIDKRDNYRALLGKSHFIL